MPSVWFKLFLPCDPLSTHDYIFTKIRWWASPKISFSSYVPCCILCSRLDGAVKSSNFAAKLNRRRLSKCEFTLSVFSVRILYCTVLGLCSAWKCRAKPPGITFIKLMNFSTSWKQNNTNTRTDENLMLAVLFYHQNVRRPCPKMCEYLLYGIITRRQHIRSKRKHQQLNTFGLNHPHHCQWRYRM